MFAWRSSWGRFVGAVVLVCSAWAARPASAQDILYCYDGFSGTDNMAAALTTFAASTTTETITTIVNNATACETAIATGTHELVILLIQGGFNTVPFPNFDAHVTGGGRAIFSTWWNDAQTVTRAGLFGAGISSPINPTNLNVLAPLSTGVTPNPVTLTNPGYFTFSQPLTVLAGASSLATLGTSSGVVARNHRTLMNGFLIGVGPNATIQQLYLNEIRYVLDADADGALIPADCNDGNAAIRPGVPDVVCDGVDQNCTGGPDDGYVGTPSSCGTGVCARTGTTVCIGGVVGTGCTPGSATGADDNCNGVDEDCSGLPDNNYPNMPTTCGVGACAATGGRFCVGGAVVNSCTPGTPGASDATCDGIDQDCSGAADEDYVVTPTSCGVGACAAMGMNRCVVGRVVNSCSPRVPALADDTCDGIDDDCNGMPDEDYASVATSCGVGVCMRSGTTSCVGGAVRDSCTPGAAGADDTTCDGLDDDCSGAADEDYAPLPTTCGAGACRGTGATSCESGAVLDSCEVGTMQPDDRTCDGVDDDCDGTTDEDYAALPTSCGVGACVAAGSTRCESGAVVDDCTPDAPAPSDATCDELDDDCDGMVDEDASCGADAGELDAGSDAGGADASSADVGAADAGPTEMDAGTMVVSSGCSCRAGGRADGRPGAAMATLAIGLLLAMARRRRT